MTTFGTLGRDGKLTNVRILSQSAMLRCPHFIMVPEHYRADESCKCDDLVEQARMVREWGYSASDFKAVA